MCGKGTTRYVYFIKASNGLTKIGCTNNINGRLSSLRISSPLPLELYYFIETEYARAAERYFHDLYRKYRKHGEWFLLDEEHLIQIKNIQLANLPNENPTQLIVRNKPVITIRIEPIIIAAKPSKPIKAYTRFLQPTDVDKDEDTIRAMPEYKIAIEMYISGQELNTNFSTRKFRIGHTLADKMCSMISGTIMRN